ncbi:MAG: hypothetical protein ACRC1H_08575, partial [Caldilineaceae bacterium]
QAVSEEGGDAVWAIGTIGDQTSKAPNNLLASAPLNIPAALFSIAEAVQAGTQEGGAVRQFTINDAGVYSFVYNEGTASVVTDELKALVDDTVARIQAGEIVVE